MSFKDDGDGDFHAEQDPVERYEGSETIQCPVCHAQVDWDEVHCPNCRSHLRLDTEQEERP